MHVPGIELYGSLKWQPMEAVQVASVVKDLHSLTFNELPRC